MGNLRYSIIYAVIRPEISEQVSVGLIIVDGEQIDVRYSRQKLNALQGLFPEKEYRFVSRVVSKMKRNKRVNTVEDVNYLTRYSNNLLAFSPLQSIDVAPTERSKDWLFRNYVYDGTRLAV
jgi:hypothetical protein